MVCIRLFGMNLAVDFTAPALLALLLLVLPAAAVWLTVSAALMHECAHLLMLALLHRRPAMLRLSAAGLRMETAGTAVIPLRLFAWILLAGPLANLAAGAAFLAAGLPAAAAANFSLCLFNLLPFRSTDGGSLLFALLEAWLLPHMPELPLRIMRLAALLTSMLLFCGMHLLRLHNPSLTGMIAFMLLSEFCGQ